MIFMSLVYTSIIFVWLMLMKCIKCNLHTRASDWPYSHVDTRITYIFVWLMLMKCIKCNLHTRQRLAILTCRHSNHLHFVLLKAANFIICSYMVLPMGDHLGTSCTSLWTSFSEARKETKLLRRRFLSLDLIFLNLQTKEQILHYFCIYHLLTQKKMIFHIIRTS